MLGAFQQYLRNQNMFCFWNIQRALEPMFSNNNFHPKSNVVENSVFSGHGRGDFRASVDKLIDAIEWSSTPWEIATENDAGHGMKVSNKRSNCTRKYTNRVQIGFGPNVDTRRVD